MIKYLLALMFVSTFCFSDGLQYLQVEAKNPASPIDAMPKVCLNVTDINNASNILVEVTNLYFQGIEPKAIYIDSNHHDNSRPSEVMPMANDNSIIVTVEVADTPRHGMTEYITLEAVDLADANKKAKEIKDKWFKDKPTKTKIKDKSK